MSEIEHLRKIFRKNIDDIPTMDYNTYIQPKKPVTYTITQNHVDIIKNYLKKFNKLTEEQQKKVSDNTDQLTGVYRIIKLTKTITSYSFSSYSVYHFMLINIVNNVLNRTSTFDDDCIGTKLELIEYVKPNKDTKKLVISRKQYYNDKTPVKLQPLVDEKPTPMVKTMIKRNLDFYYDMYKTHIGDYQFSCSYIYIYSASINSKKYMFYSKKKLDLSNEKVMKPFVKKIRNIEIIKKYIKKHKTTTIKYEFILKHVVDNDLHLDIILDRFSILMKPFFNKNFRLNESSFLLKPLSIDMKKRLKQFIFIRVNKLLWNRRLDTKINKKLKNKRYVYIISNKRNKYATLRFGKYSPLIIINKLYDSILQNEKLDSLQRDMSIYKESDFNFKVIHILRKNHTKSGVMKEIRRKHKPFHYDR